MANHRSGFYWFSLLLMVLGFLAGTTVGFMQGLSAYPLINAAPQGSLALAQLNAIESGKTEALRFTLEYKIDYALAAQTYLEQSWWYPIYQSGYLDTPADNTERLRRIATYRKHHPGPNREDMLDKNPQGKQEYTDQYRELATGIREYQRRVRSTVDKYAE